MTPSAISDVPTLATFKIKGSGIVAALENGLSQIADVAGRFPQVAGLKYTFDKTKEVGSRLVGDVLVQKVRLSVDGQPVERMPIHRRARLGLSYLPQEASIFRKLKVEDNVRAVLELQRDEDGKPLQHDEIEKRLTSLLQELRVDHLRASPSVALSGGERRRVEIARALATNPRFILLDEPFAGVDPIAVGEIQRIVRFLRDRQIGVLITDHNVRETLGICDHAYIISEGSVLASGKPDQIIENDAVRRVYLGENFRM